MSENRRYAFRVNLGQPGELRYGRKSAPCTVVDVSVTGARIRLDEPRLVPDRCVLLTTEIAGEKVSVLATLRRSEPGGLLALSFDNADNAPLSRLIAECQRRDIRSGLLGALDRRRSPSNAAG